MIAAWHMDGLQTTSNEHHTKWLYKSHSWRKFVYFIFSFRVCRAASALKELQHQKKVWHCKCKRISWKITRVNFNGRLIWQITTQPSEREGWIGSIVGFHSYNAPESEVMAEVDHRQNIIKWRQMSCCCISYMRFSFSENSRGLSIYTSDDIVADHETRTRHIHALLWDD